MKRTNYDKDYILARIKVDQKTGCWNWTRMKKPLGYGVIAVRVGRRDQPQFQKMAHRVAYELWKGAPGELFVCHKCDNPPCCNPDHLFLGTAKDNFEDAVAKGRMTGRPPHLKGERIGTSKLTTLDVCEIRASTGPHKPIADKFGVSATLICMIRNKTCWRHLP